MAEAVATRTGFVFLQQWFWPHIDMYVADHRAWRGCGRRVEALRRLYIYIYGQHGRLCAGSGFRQGGNGLRPDSEWLRPQGRGVELSMGSTRGQSA